MKLATYNGDEVTIVVKLNIFRDEVYLDVLNKDGDTIRFHTDLQERNLRRTYNGLLVTPDYMSGMLNHACAAYHRKKHSIFSHRLTGDEMLHYARKIKDLI